MPREPAYRFGDLLALARRDWVAQLAAGLAAAAYPDYRRSDAAVVRLLDRGARPVGKLGDALGVTRQAARKIVTGLQRRGFAEARRGRDDARQLDVELTAEGRAYARVLTTVIDDLNRSLAERVTADQLAAADVVLRAVLTERSARALADRLPHPS
ncbi:MAG: hypothetical protein BGO26_19095 [Actinobacteria bacterium 69-20]|nr:MAG: hypothetical protein BGO26_19095 [Actinobacteria bacterium 69-20]